jgi:CRISPR-associated Csx2 family protein
MPTKILISFLGPTPYQTTAYYWLPDRSDLGTPVPYVQEAIIRKCLPDWSVGDKVYVFTTAAAQRNNFEHRVKGFDRETGQAQLEEGSGLLAVLEGLQSEGCIHHFEAVVIPEGHTEQEIFQVFQKIFDKLETDAEVYFDITFSFRSLPMLGIVLLNYAKKVMDAKVKAIYYGNYEAGRAEQQLHLQNARHKQLDEATIQRLKDNPVQAPILNLLSLSILQDWTSAASEFIKLGKTDSLAALVAETQPDLARQLTNLEQSISTCRGQLLTQELDISALKDKLLLIKNEPIQEQLRPLIHKIEQKISLFENRQLLQNGFAAVTWCIQHGMIQQGITFLLETLVSHIIEKMVGDQHLTNLRFRQMAGGALNGIPGNSFRFMGSQPPLSSNEKDIYWTMEEEVANAGDLQKYYWELTGKEGFRNDINHCGFKTDYLTPTELTHKLKTLFQNIQNLNL